MAAAAAATTSTKDTESKTNGNEEPKIKGLQQWVPCEGDQVKTLKRCMDAVKDKFFEMAKKVGYDPKEKEYYPTDTGICLLLPPYVLNGYSFYIGLVRLSKPGLLGGYWASVRARLPIGIEEKITLEGFIITTFSNLNFVGNGQYEFSDGLGTKREYPKGWHPCSNTLKNNSGESTLKALKSAMNSVKDSFFEMAKNRGYDPVNKEYHPTDTGICQLLPKGLLIGFDLYIGLVQLSKPGTIGGYYASILVSVPVEIISPNELKGFIIDAKPCLQYVHSNVFRFGSNVKPDGKEIKLMSKNKTSGLPELTFINGSMDYLPTGGIQTTVDSMKDSIKKKCGIISDLDTFQVVAATAYPSYGINVFSYFVKIYIGINNQTNFTNYIYVKYNVSLYGVLPPSTYLVSAQTFPF